MHSFFGTQLIVILPVCIFSILVSIPLSVLVHELGHFIGGRISGYRLIYFSCMGWLYIKKEYRGTLTTEGIGKCFGQCVMYSEYCGKRPYLLILGGCIANFVMALIFIPIGFYGEISLLCTFFPFGAINLSLGLANYLSMSAYSDGRAFRECVRDAKDMVAYNNIMRISRYLALGYSVYDIPAELFEVYSHNPDSALSAEMEGFVRERKGNVS